MYSEMLRHRRLLRFFFTKKIQLIKRYSYEQEIFLEPQIPEKWPLITEKRDNYHMKNEDERGISWLSPDFLVEHFAKLQYF
jgi:hypothetical protein